MWLPPPPNIQVKNYTDVSFQIKAVFNKRIDSLPIWLYGDWALRSHEIETFTYKCIAQCFVKNKQHLVDRARMVEKYYAMAISPFLAPCALGADQSSILPDRKKAYAMTIAPPWAHVR